MNQLLGRGLTVVFVFSCFVLRVCVVSCSFYAVRVWLSSRPLPDDLLQVRAVHASSARLFLVLSKLRRQLICWLCVKFLYNIGHCCALHHIGWLRSTARCSRMVFLSQIDDDVHHVRSNPSTCTENVYIALSWAPPPTDVLSGTPSRREAQRGRHRGRRQDVVRRHLVSSEGTLSSMSVCWLEEVVNTAVGGVGASGKCGDSTLASRREGGTVHASSGNAGEMLRLYEREVFPPFRKPRTWSVNGRFHSCPKLEEASDDTVLSANPLTTLL